VRFGSLRGTGEHNAQNLEIVAYIDYRLQQRHSHTRRRKFGFNKTTS
jgi:hypothetical protein